MEQNVIISIVATVVIVGLASVALLSSLGGDIGAVEKQVTGAQAKVSAVEGKVAKIAPPPTKRTFTVSGIEIKGSTDKLDPPPTDPTKLSDGYRYKGPGVFDPANPKKWEVSSYIWEAGPLVGYQGDTVELVIFIINGDKHDTHIEDPDGIEVVMHQNLSRGREYIIPFKAEKAGIYQLICTEHEPTMKTPILVLSRP